MQTYHPMMFVAILLGIDTLHTDTLAPKGSNPAGGSSKSISGGWQIPEVFFATVKVLQTGDNFSFEMIGMIEVRPLVNVEYSYAGEGVVDSVNISLNYDKKSGPGGNDSGKCVGNFQTTNKITWNCKGPDGNSFSYSWIR